jgi:hypothetical protein
MPVHNSFVRCDVLASQDGNDCKTVYARAAPFQITLIRRPALLKLRYDFISVLFPKDTKC